MMKVADYVKIKANRGTPRATSFSRNNESYHFNMAGNFIVEMEAVKATFLLFTQVYQLARMEFVAEIPYHEAIEKYGMDKTAIIRLSPLPGMDPPRAYLNYYGLYSVVSIYGENLLCAAATSTSATALFHNLKPQQCVGITKVLAPGRKRWLMTTFVTKPRNNNATQHESIVD